MRRYARLCQIERRRSDGWEALDGASHQCDARGRWARTLQSRSSADWRLVVAVAAAVVVIAAAARLR